MSSPDRLNIDGDTTTAINDFVDEIDTEVNDGVIDEVFSPTLPKVTFTVGRPLNSKTDQANGSPTRKIMPGVSSDVFEGIRKSTKQRMTLSLPDVHIRDYARQGLRYMDVPNYPALQGSLHALKSAMQQNHEFAALLQPKRYMPIVEPAPTETKLLSALDKRSVEFVFPGWCYGCRLCYGCLYSNIPHLHREKAVRTGGGFTYMRRERARGNNPYIEEPKSFLNRFMNTKDKYIPLPQWALDDIYRLAKHAEMMDGKRNNTNADVLSSVQEAINTQVADQPPPSKVTDAPTKDVVSNGDGAADNSGIENSEPSKVSQPRQRLADDASTAKQRRDQRRNVKSLRGRRYVAKAPVNETGDLGPIPPEKIEDLANAPEEPPEESAEEEVINDQTAEIQPNEITQPLQDNSRIADNSNVEVRLPPISPKANNVASAALKPEKSGSFVSVPLVKSPSGLKSIRSTPDLRTKTTAPIKLPKYIKQSTNIEVEDVDESDDDDEETVVEEDYSFVIASETPPPPETPPETKDIKSDYDAKVKEIIKSKEPNTTLSLSKPKKQWRSTLMQASEKQPTKATEEISNDRLDIQDPLDYLSKYCIILPNRLPTYEMVFNKTVQRQRFRYADLSAEAAAAAAPTDDDVADNNNNNAASGQVLQPVPPPLPSAEVADATNNMWQGVPTLQMQATERARIAKQLEAQHLPASMKDVDKNIGDQRVEKIDYLLTYLQEQEATLSDQLQNLKDEQVSLVANVIRTNFPQYVTNGFKTQKRSKKNIKSTRVQELDMELSNRYPDHEIFRKTDNKVKEKIFTIPSIGRQNHSLTRTKRKLHDIRLRIDKLQNERAKIRLFSQDMHFIGQTADAKPEDFVRRQSLLYQTLNPEVDLEMNIDVMESALQSVNNNLLTKKEFKFIYKVLNIPSRSRLNMKLFACVAALSEKVIQLEPMVRKLINKCDVEALNHKMDRCKELFYLLDNKDVDSPNGTVKLDSLLVELMAGGLNDQHIVEVIQKFDREKRGYVEFLDFLTYVPLFVEIHERIVRDPFNVQQNW